MMNIKKKNKTSTSLQELREKLKNDEFIKEKILKSFKSIEKNSIEDFLYNKAIDFEKSSISATHIIFNEKGSEVLGYFTLANKSLIIKKEKFEKFSKTQQKRFSQSGRILENGSCVVNSFLIAQIGKNYALKKDEQIKGMEILNIAYDLLYQVKKILNTKYIWLECEKNKKIISFYEKFGFNLIKNIETENELETMILQLKN